MVKIQFDHFRKNDVIGKRDAIIEIGFFFVYFQPDHEVPGDEEHSSDEGPDEMFRFIKVRK